jgi:Glycosyltransferase 61
MLGEFYDRGLIHLWRLWKENPWIGHSQLYVHLQPPTSKKLLDSHHLFTSMFRTMPLLDFNLLLDETPCTCLPRLVFCGYDINYRNDTIHIGGKPNETAVRESVVLEPIAIEPPGYNPQSALGTTTHRELHSHVRATMIESNPHVVTDIAEFRKAQLNKAGGRTRRKMSDSELSKWMLVGLAQRTGRRRWRDLDMVMLRAQKRLAEHRIALVEVNVESPTSTAYKQIVTHGALDGLVGIHGAQLTEAVWMKPGSWVIELLPYVPDGVFMGTWTKTTDEPTPIGWMFDGTELNHAGVPLPRESAPYCWDPKDVNDPALDCWRIGNNPWDNRDFIFDSTNLELILSKLLVGTSPATTCSEYQERAGNHSVLYNINCATGAGNAVATHHFYWKKIASKR